MYVPDEVVRRLSGMPAERVEDEGKALCAEIIQQVRRIRRRPGYTSWPSAGRTLFPKSSNGRALSEAARSIRARVEH
jgi:hypothetical protein